MCGVIIEGSNIQLDIVTDMDIFAQKNGGELDEDFIEKKTGPRKLFPCGTKCTYCGINVPCMVACSEGGGISSEILVQFLMHMDKLNLPPPQQDGWQVGNLSEQNGSYKMAILKAKKELV